MFYGFKDNISWLKRRQQSIFTMSHYFKYAEPVVLVILSEEKYSIVTGQLDIPLKLYHITFI